jgi:DNA-binding winged helix-turn-helix (wHTH) protein/tetratricopeptide (TPR) repeat protein/TolB-like protein
MSTSESPLYAFGDFVLDPRERRLLGAGVPVSLTPKAFDLLVLLVERAGTVVSKDEIMKVIWPRGYVEESNLVKHVWMIRRALGDDDESNRYIETVPKLGYRFIASVGMRARAAAGGAAPPGADAGADMRTAAVGPLPVAEAGVAATPIPPPPSAGSDANDAPRIGATTPADVARSRKSRPLLLGAVLAIVVLLAIGGLRSIGASRGATPGARLALAGFVNANQPDDIAWLNPALRDMLATELTATADLQVVPEELVRDAGKDLPPPGALGFSSQALARLRTRLRADYVISGTFRTSGTADDRTLRVDLALQDARSGALVAAVANQGPQSAVRGIVTDLATELRRKLGIAVPGAEAVQFISKAQPPTTEVARHVGIAVDALDHFDAARARDESLEAVALAPGYAPAYVCLAKAWAALGYDQKARAAAEQARLNSAALPPEMTLRIRAAAEESRAEWKTAAATWTALVHEHPKSLEYRLALIQALMSAAEFPAAKAALDDLRGMPTAASDPRVSLVAADMANDTTATRDALREAKRALSEAQQMDAPGLVADAETMVAEGEWRLGQLADAERTATAAIDHYRALGNPRGEAEARVALANVLGDQHRQADALAEDQRALELFRSIGNQRGIARVYQHLGEALWTAGDRDGADVAVRHALQTGRELGDLRLEAWSLRALANIASDEAATDEALAQLRESAALDLRIGGPGRAAFGFGAYADIARVRGELADALEACARAEAALPQVTGPSDRVSILVNCAEVRLDQGDAAAAGAMLQEVVKTAQVTAGLELAGGNADLLLAQIDMDAGRWESARDRLVHAGQMFATMDSRTGEADAQALLAVCEQALADPSARDEALGRARGLKGSISAKLEVYPVEIALAQLAGNHEQRVAAVANLHELSADAQHRHWVTWAAEADLVAWRLLVLDDQKGPAERLRADTERLARSHGLGRILSLLHPTGVPKHS